MPSKRGDFERFNSDNKVRSFSLRKNSPMIQPEGDLLVQSKDLTTFSVFDTAQRQAIATKLHESHGNAFLKQIIPALQRQGHHSQKLEHSTAQQVDLSDWVSLLNFVPSQKIQDIVSNRNNIILKHHPGLRYMRWEIQKVENGVGKVNLDYYPVKIQSLPRINGKRVTAANLLSHVRKNINNYIDKSNSVFTPYDTEETRKWFSSKPLGSIVHIDLGGWLNPDDGSVIVSNFSPDSWTFSTIQTPHDMQHPVSGNRQFGFTPQPDGSYIFYTRGADRATGILDFVASAGVNIAWEQADKLWKSLQKHIVDFVNNHEGKAWLMPSTSQRYDWDIIKKHYWLPSKNKSKGSSFAN